MKTLSRTYLTRGKTAKEIKKLGEEQWEIIHEYGKRWTVGIYFSGFKRGVMGEIMRTRKRIA